MVAKKTWTLAALPDRRLIARVSERVREVATLRTLVDMQCNRYAIYREALLAVGHEHVAWPTCRKDVAVRRLSVREPPAGCRSATSPSERS